MKQCKCEHWQICPTCKPDMFDAGGKMLPARPTPLQDAKAEIERLTAEVERLDRESSACDMLEEMRQDVQTMTDALGFANREIERLTMGIENCRLLAARHRKEPWALLILGFCAEAGVVGSVTR